MYYNFPVPTENDVDFRAVWIPDLLNSFIKLYIKFDIFQIFYFPVNLCLQFFRLFSRYFFQNSILIWLKYFNHTLFIGIGVIG